MKKFLPLWCLLLMSSGYADVAVESDLALVYLMNQLERRVRFLSLSFVLLTIIFVAYCCFVITKLKQKRDKIGDKFLQVEFKYLMLGFLVYFCALGFFFCFFTSSDF